MCFLPCACGGSLLDKKLVKINNKKNRLLQTDEAVMLLLFVAWWTGLINGCSRKADRLGGWGGGSDLRFCFFFHQTSYLWECWVESSRRRNVKKRGDTQRSCRLSSTLGYAWPTLAAALDSNAMVATPNSLHAKIEFWFVYLPWCLAYCTVCRRNCI